MGGLGIDVAKASLQVCLLSKEEEGQEAREEQFALENTPEGIRKLLRRLRRLEVERVAVEATGGYEWGLLAALVETGVPACRINPARIRDFAKAMGKLAKTGPIDARVIAEYAAVAAPRELHKVSPQEKGL
jgi:transposase